MGGVRRGAKEASKESGGTHAGRVVAVCVLAAVCLCLQSTSGLSGRIEVMGKMGGTLAGLLKPRACTPPKGCPAGHRKVAAIVREMQSIRERTARAASRVAAKHASHRRSRQLQLEDELVRRQNKQIASLEARLVHAEQASNRADGNAATQRQVAGGQTVHAPKPVAVKPTSSGVRPWGEWDVARNSQGDAVKVDPHGAKRAPSRNVILDRREQDRDAAKAAGLYHVMHAPGARNVANHRDAVEYNYRHHDAAWDGNRIASEGRGDRLDRHVSRYPDLDAPSSPGGYNFVYGKDETYAPQDYGSYYGPQAYYDGYYSGGDGSNERATRNGAGRVGRGRRGRGRHVYAYASPYDRSEEFRQHENYVNMLYHWYVAATNENQQQAISDAQKWQYNAAQQAYDAYLRDQASPSS